MRQVRNNVFETNSSSTHSISISRRGSLEKSNLMIEYDGYIHTHLGEYGWEVRNYYTQADRLLYLVTMAWEKSDYCNEDDLRSAIDRFMETPEFREISDKVGKYAECSGVLLEYEDGYIDHQSHEDYGSLNDFLGQNEIDLVEFIFRSGVIVHTDNDNY